LGLTLGVLVAVLGPAFSRQDADALFRKIETGTPRESLEASGALTGVFDDSMLPRLEMLIDAVPLRALQLLGDLKTDGSAKLLLRRLPQLLESKTPEVPRMAAVACGLRRLRGATPLLLERTEDKSSLRALGRIWERGIDAPDLDRKDEIDRLSTLAIVHRIAMGATSSLEACEAMLKVMTRTELDDFLEKHARDKFYARRYVDEAVRKKGFNKEKGGRVHQALLGSPDADLVAGILTDSPFPLDREAVRTLIRDPRTSSDGRKIGDLASKCLEER
jgi:hypothetical protein